jgi:N-methylhydantoinase B
VQADVRQGYVSVAAAAELYGVVIDAETYEVDVAASERLRTQQHERGSGRGAA